MTTTAVEGARRAGASSVCAAPGCTVVICPGDLIVRLAAKGWAHRDCARANRTASTKEGS
jgi:hypothetical protein